MGSVNVCEASKGLATTKAAGVTVEIRGAVCIELCEIVEVVDVVTTGRGDLVLIPLRLGLALVFDSGAGELIMFGAFVDFRCVVCCICRKFCIPCS